MAHRLAPRPASALALLLSTAAAAQELPPQRPPVQEVTATPTTAPTPVATATPTPTTSPTPVPAPTTAMVRGVGERPPPIVVPRARPTTPVAVQPIATPAAAASPTVEPTPAPSATALPPIETVILPQSRTTILPWPWLAGAAGLLTFALGWLFLRRPREEPLDVFVTAQDVVEPAATEPDALPSSAPAGSARLKVELRPMRAGLNLISATAECEIVVTNIGGAPASGARASLLLTSAHDGQDGQFADFYADAAARPAIPPFVLAAGEERRFRAVTALPHDAIHALEAAGRPMFVPLVAVAVHYRDGDAARRVGRAFALGLERAGSAKLAPLWLDGPARSYDGVAARAYGEAVEG